MTTLLISLTIDPANQSQVLDMLRDNIHIVIRTGRLDRHQPDRDHRRKPQRTT